MPGSLARESQSCQIGGHIRGCTRGLWVRWFARRAKSFPMIGISSRTIPIIENTTNINEGQHFWTSRHTGTNLSLLEAIVKARKLDQATAAEIEACLKSGVLTNNTNDLYNRMLHNCARNDNLLAKSAATRKVKEQLKENMAEGAGTVKKPAARRRAGPVAESSSSGRAPALKASKGKARTQCAPYRTPNHDGTASGTETRSVLAPVVAQPVAVPTPTAVATTAIVASVHPVPNLNFPGTTGEVHNYTPGSPALFDFSNTSQSDVMMPHYNAYQHDGAVSR
ncbi:hypothetical protein HGRIS_006525 [Hohenbuehelia grisea]|uniref:Uncharacterized protein n=1 Tax=Hohenbuehelia grisea TaxID=104357 RepID=A0ABR3J984_9AGAR